MTAWRAASVGPVAVLVAFALAWAPLNAGNRRLLDLGIEAMVVAGAATGLNVLVGSTGLLSLGHAGFFVAGGYAGGLLGPHLLGEGSVLPDAVARNAPWLGWAVALVVGGALGGVLAVTCCHLRGFHLTMVTLAFGALVPAVALLAADQLGGLGGRTLQRVPDTRNAFLARDHALAGVYYTSVLYLLGALALVWNLGRSRWGRALAAVRDSEAAARASGIDPWSHRVAAFAVSAAVVAVAGWVGALRTLSVSPGSVLDVQAESFRYVIAVALGGAGTLAGPVIGAFAVTFGLGLDVVQDRLQGRLGLALGALGLAVVALAPRGLVGLLEPWAARARRGRAEPVPVPAPSASAPVAPLTPGPGGDGGAGETVGGGPAGRTEPLLRVSGLRRSFGGVAALAGVDLTVHGGEVHALVGPNGSGKSTLLNVVSGHEEATGGQVALAGRALGRLPAHRRAALGLGRTFQGGEVWLRMGVVDNVLAGAHRRGSAGLGRCLLGLAGPEERRLRRRAGGLLALVGLGGRGGAPAGALTPAEQRRLGLARALAAEPRVLLLDEPVAGMAPADAAALLGLVRRLAHERGMGVLLVEHQVGAVLAVADVVTVLDHGVVLAHGSPARVATDPQVREAYLGLDGGPDHAPGGDRPPEG